MADRACRPTARSSGCSRVPSRCRKAARIAWIKRMHRQYGALSGIAIVLIAINHAIHFGLEVNPVDGAARHALVFLQALGAFAVPAFLFISGAFLSYSAGQLSWAFVRSNVGRILWPYLVWSALFYVVVLLTNGERQSAPGYVKSLVVGYPYHFVP